MGRHILTGIACPDHARSEQIYGRRYVKSRKTLEETVQQQD